MPLKDFHAEIRAFKDVEDFLSRTLLMLDLQKTGLTQIIEAMVQKLLEKKEVSAQTSLEEARHAIFTQDSGQNHPHRLQGTTFIQSTTLNSIGSSSFLINPYFYLETYKMRGDHRLYTQF